MIVAKPVTRCTLALSLKKHDFVTSNEISLGMHGVRGASCKNTPRPRHLPGPQRRLDL